MKPGDVDLADPNNVVRYEGAPVEYFAALRRDDPVHWNELTDAGRQETPNLQRGFWVLTRYEDVVRASKDHAYFSSHLGGPVLFKDLLTRLPDIHVVEPPERLTTVWFDAIQKMEVEFTPN